MLITCWLAEEKRPMALAEWCSVLLCAARVLNTPPYSLELPLVVAQLCYGWFGCAVPLLLPDHLLLPVSVRGRGAKCDTQGHVCKDSQSDAGPTSHDLWRAQWTNAVALYFFLNWSFVTKLIVSPFLPPPLSSSPFNYNFNSRMEVSGSASFFLYTGYSLIAGILFWIMTGVFTLGS